MKKVILSLAALFAFTVASAQETTSGAKGFSNGDIFMTGAVGFGTTSTGDYSTSQFTIAPSVGFFVSDNIAVGVELGYTSATEDNEIMFMGEPVMVEQTTKTLGIGGFGRYYFTPANDFSFFGQLSIAYASSTFDSGYPGEDEVKANGFNIGLAPGISYFISNNFALQASIGVLGYTTVKPDYDNAESTDTFELGLDMNDVRFGLVYKF